MIKLLEQIKQDSKQALKQGEKEKANSLRYLVSLIQTKQIETGEEFSQDDVVQVLQKELKQKKEALEAFEKAEREDLARQEKEEIKLLKQYLPEMMDEAEIKQVVEGIVEKEETNNFGEIMGKVMAKLQGKAQGGKVSKIVQQVLDQ